MLVRNTIILLLVLILIGCLPNIIGLCEFLYGGGLGWSMIWSNEIQFWQTLFTAMSLLVFFRTILKAKNKMTAGLWLMPALLAHLVCVYEIIQFGYGQSSKGDSPTLEPISFWFNCWWFV